MSRERDYTSTYRSPEESVPGSVILSRVDGEGPPAVRNDRESIRGSFAALRRLRMTVKCANRRGHEELMGDLSNAKDPVVEEIHEIRRKLLEEYGGMDGYLRHIKELEAELKDRIVHREPRKPVLTNHKAS
jgi:hypothetical protein